MFKIFMIWLGVLLLLIGFIFGTDYLGLQWFKFIEPKRENIKRNIFENTQSYVRSKNQDLLRYYRQFLKADNNEKQTISEFIRQEFANFPEEKVNSEKLREFLKEIKYK